MSKLENASCQDLFKNYDIICLTEVKCTYPFSMQGFHCIRSLIISGEENRGGTAVLFKNNLWNQVYDVKYFKDQIWFKLDKFKDLYFEAVYIPPRDSPYFTPDSFSYIHEMACDYDCNLVMFGDFNARIKDLSVFNDNTQGISYVQNIDNGINSNGKDLTDLCIACKLKPVNHLEYNKRHFEGMLTFKRQNIWISQLDWVIMSQAALDSVSKFTIIQSVSLPTNHAPLELHIECPPLFASDILCRATQLGSSVTDTRSNQRRSVKVQNIDASKFLETIPPVDIFWHMSDLNTLCESISSHLYNAAVVAEVSNCTNRPNQQQDIATCHERWLRIVKSRDAKQLWQSINWHGHFDTTNDVLCHPSDDCFCEHYQKLLNPEGITPLDYQVEYFKYVPILDDPISPGEVFDSLKLLKANKSAGTDGVAPGLLKLLPENWITLLTYLFNCVFFNTYPTGWTIARVFNVFKKGDRLNPSNYRGISVVVSLAKLYDLILSERFRLWHKPMYEQAGAQKGRSCTEQILTLRLLIDISRKKKCQLYALFVDYKKAYDMVDRKKLMAYLDRRGCGSTFLSAVQSSYAFTKGQIGDCSFDASAGVRQGACTSCPLFVFFIEPTIEAIKNLGPDNWLGDLHTLLLMDDTVILASSREQMEAKLCALKAAADDIGMVINQSKTQYICTNVSDPQPFKIDNLVVEHTNVYTYLGTPISAMSIADQVKLHLQQKTPHVLKFFSFLSKNHDAPFPIKCTVWNSALKATIFYSCETWLTKDLRAAETIYNNTLKSMLGVRSTTCNDLVFAESGHYGAKSHILQLQTNFLQKVKARDDFHGSYLERVLKLAQDTRCPAGLMLISLANAESQNRSCEAIQQAIRSSDSTRRTAYRNINPTLSVSPVYTSCLIPECNRIAFTRIRLSSHHMRYETGRWARIPPDQRLCACGAIQTDFHVLLECRLTEHVRESNNIIQCMRLCDLFDNFEMKNVTRLCKDILDCTL